MFGFGGKIPIDQDELDWQFATYRWLIHEFGGWDRFVNTPLILPNREFFVPPESEGHAFAEQVFAQVKKHAGLDHWACRLEAGEEGRPISLAPFAVLEHSAAVPAGTFQLQEDANTPVVITYDPQMLNDSYALIATFAHELGHYLLATAKFSPPGGWQLHEPATDLAAVFMGLGLFMANTAFRFQQFQSSSTGSQGWSCKQQGYLREAELLTALAIFNVATGYKAKHAAGYLKHTAGPVFLKAVKALEGGGDIKQRIQMTSISRG